MDREWDGPDRRSPDKRLKEAARLGALEAMGQFTPHDLSTKEGREALRSDLQFAHDNRSRCDAMKSSGGKAVITGLCMLAFMAVASIGSDVWKAIRGMMP